MTGDPVQTWRKQQRAALLAQRKMIPREQREEAARVIGPRLDQAMATLGCPTVGVYWPINNEINLLHWARDLAERTRAALCLPVVVTPKQPLEY